VLPPLLLMLLPELMLLPAISPPGDDADIVGTAGG
jgi:hypothetical protein